MRPFVKRFKFDAEKNGLVGIERESFLARGGKIVPIAAEVLAQINNHVNYGYELSACQLETRTNPTNLHHLGHILQIDDEELEGYRKKLDFETIYSELAPYDIPLDVYPDPSGRYQQITKNMSEERLRAACRVAGTHVHIGMASPEQAITAYNKAITHLDDLCRMGDHSDGERLRIYKINAPNFLPPPYENWKAYEQYATEQDFVERPRNCWHLIRISIHGTIEFRMFGTTPNRNKIIEWARICHSICTQNL